MKKIMLFIFGSAMMFIVQHSAIAADPNVKVMQKEGAGSYLADSIGKTLYWLKKDSKNTSNCPEHVWKIGRPLSAGGMLTVAQPLKKTDFEPIDQPDLKKQNIFRGYPICYYGSLQKV